MKTIVDLLRAQPAFVSAKAPTAQEVTQAEQSLGGDVRCGLPRLCGGAGRGKL